MPLLTGEERIAFLRKKYPTLTHTSWRELSEIVPHPNVDKHHQQMGDIVCATSSDSDFYALRCNERQGMINYSIPYHDSDGIVNRIFIFEKMKDTYYEHIVSSENFTPIVSEKGVFSGEWVSHDVIKPISVRVGNNKDILERTPAKVFIISNLEQFRAKLSDDTFVKGVRNAGTALETILELVRTGILKEANNSGELINRPAKFAEDGKNMAQEDTSKDTLSVVQQAVLNAKKSQH